MPEPRDLYELHDSLSDPAAATGTGPADGTSPSAGPVLLHVFTGFIDAGQAGSLARDHLLSTLEH